MAEQGSNAESGDDEALFDERVRQALQRTPVPSGLAARLQAQLRAQTLDANESAFASDQASPELWPNEHSPANRLRTVSESTERTSVHTSPAAGGFPGRELESVTATSMAGADVPVDAGGNETVVRQRPSRHLRRSLITAAALAAAIGLIAVGRVWFRPAATLDDLVSVCRTEVARWERTVTSPTQDADLELPPEIARLDLNGFQWVGARYFQSESFGTGASWKLQRREDEVIILIFEQATPVASLAQNLTVLQSSGVWSLAAMQASDRIVVIASRGDVRRFLRPIA